MKDPSDNPLWMYFFYSHNTMKSWFQYRVDAILRSLAVFLREATGIIVIYITLTKFDDIGGWNIDELLFLFSLIFITYGILIIFFTGLRDFENIIYDGSFDRLILRPRGLLFQVIASNSDWFAAIGHGGLGIVLFIYSAGRVNIHWNTITILYYLAAVLGGVLIQGAMFLVFAILSFFIVKASKAQELIYWNMRKFSGYPISIFPKFVQYMMMYVVPFAFVNYFPAQYLLRKDDMHQYPEIYLYITPLIGIAMYFIAYLFWRYSIKFYKSTGT